MTNSQDWEGHRIYGDIEASTIIRQGRMAQIEIWWDAFGKKERLILPNKLAAQNMVKELQRLIKEWPKNK